MSDAPETPSGDDLFSSFQNMIAEKDAEIVRLSGLSESYRSEMRIARASIQTLCHNLKTFIVEGIENGEDKDILRSLAEVAEIDTVTEVTKSITITAEVEVGVDIFDADSIEDHRFDFTITYDDFGLTVRNGYIQIEDS